VSVFRRLKNAFFNCTAQFTQTAEERPLFRVIRERNISRIVELGIGDAERSLRMIQAAVKANPGKTVEFAGIDLFEARHDHARGITLKAVHRKLKSDRCRVRLLPGDPFGALAQYANSLLGTELLVISADQTGESLDRAWFYVPRLLAMNASVYVEKADPKTGELVPQLVSLQEVESLAVRMRPRRAA
jgi:hypothetical protein